ncbi:MAG TPA: 1-(5-phosphoribosyl)-5-[(5-phosphoribosylamino)methylideneamino]imidazole-4-carboxamide isomerase [Chloroflexota bacterium]|nr:1-(5-phosphoribosyl)-5-[(5-phosphoribosylamino)methylideneamino]imidazole-4-carboxamide isomerase [Chloroflexota bacterium]
MAIPAVDIRGGRCVRLIEGDFSRETSYADDPAIMAQHWAEQGAQRLHVVDLDGARDGVRANAATIERLLQALSIPVQVGGGVRTLETARALLEAGADRVVVGTAAAEHPEALAEWVDALGAEHLVIGVDTRDGFVATRGWQTPTELQTLDFCRALKRSGIERVLYTDVARDGRLSGPDVAGTRAVAEILSVIGSGGVATVADLQALADAGAEAAIVGTALYEHRITLKEALAVTC